MSAFPSSGPSAGGRRFWATVLFFVFANVTVWFVYHSYVVSQQPRRDILTMQHFTENIEDSVDQHRAKRALLSWTFNLNVARPGPIKPTIQGQLPGNFSPPIVGDWLWSDARTLSFQPAELLPRATRFTATLTPALIATADGYTLSAPITSTFSTAPLELLSVKQAGFDDSSRMLLEFTFNDKVIPREVLAHVELNDQDTGALKGTLNGEATGNTVRILTDPIQFKDVSRDKTLSVDVTHGLAGASGPLGIDQDMHWDVPVSGVLAADKLEATVPSEGDPELTLTFNNALTDEGLEALKNVISITPNIPFNLRKSYRGAILNASFLPATRYTVTIGKAQSKNPKTLFRPGTLSTFVPDRDPAAYFTNTTGYLGSKGNRTLLVKAVNVPAVRVTVSRVYENNLVAWRNAHLKYWQPDRADNYAHPIASHRFVLPTQKNKLQEVRVDLDELLGKEAKDGTYKLSLTLDSSASAADESADEEDYYRNEYGSDENTSALVTLSDIGLTSKLMADAGGAGNQQALLTWAVSLSTGKPLGNIHLRIYSSKNQLLGEGVSDNDGLARIDHLNPAEGETPAILIAEADNNALTYLDLSKAARNDRITASEGGAYLRSGYEAFVWSERGVYRPGESVMLRAIVRGKDMSVPPADLPLRFQIHRPDGRDWIAKTVHLDADGGAEWKVTFPSDAQTGYWSASLGLPGDAARGSSAMHTYGNTEFQIEEFIPDRIKVALTLANLAPAVADIKPRISISEKPLLVDMQSDYLFGQPAANLAAQLTTSITPTSFSTKNFPSADGWISGDTADVSTTIAENKRPSYAHVQATPQTLDQNGRTQFAVDLEKSLAPEGESNYTFRGPWHLTLMGTTLETGGRPVTAYAATEADALPYYLMVRPTDGAQTGYVSLKTSANYQIRLVNPSGELSETNDAVLTATVYKESWETNLTRNQGRYEYKSTHTLSPLKAFTDVAVTAANGFRWQPTDVGNYIIQFTDATTHQITTTRLYVGEEGGWADNINREDPEALTVQLFPAETKLDDVKTTPVPATFRAGQSVKAVVRAPFAGKLLLTVETDTVLLSKVVDMTGTVGEVTFDLPKDARPNGYVAATVIRAIDANSKEWSTHRAFGLTRFMVDSSDRKLNIAIASPSEIRPSTQLDVQLTVTDAQGNPARNAAIAVTAVDEGILRLTSFETPSPLEYFNSPRALGITTADIYSQLMPEVARLDTVSPTGGGGEGDDFGHRHSSPVAAKRVRTVSLISEIVHTDSDGKIAVHLSVPEFLGQLRIMAVSYAGPLTGSAEKSALVRSPLVVQSSFPRFLAPGDRCEVPLLLINNSKAAGDAHIKLTTDGPLNFDRTDAAVALQPGEQKTVRFTLTAAQSAAVGHIVVEASMADSLFSEHTELPVRPASPTISRGDYASVTSGKPLNLNIPDDLLPGTGTLQLRVAQRPALGLPEGLDYLDRYPYGCVEQTTSEALPLVYLHDIGAQIAPGVFEQDSMNRKVQTGIMRLMAMQTADGGLSMWTGETTDWEWGSVYAAHFMVEAEHAGYSVPVDFKSHLLAYLRSLLAKSAEAGAGTELQAYALYVLALDGKPDRAAMNRLGEVLEEFNLVKNPPEGIAQARFELALAYAASGRKDFAEKLLPETLPSMRTTRNLAGNIGSPIRDQALVILTLLAVNPNHPQLPALIERLSLAGQQHGWQSTQDNAFAVMALGKYLRTVKEEKPFETAALLAAEKTLAATDAGKALNWSGEPGAFAVKITGPQNATGFVSWLQTGVPLVPPANADHAIKIRRSYQTEEGVPLADEIAAGTAVKVQISIDTPTALENLVVEDLLPAGLEIENPRLATTKKVDDAISTLTVSRLEVRDDRFIVVGSVPAGSSTYTYLARAVTTGAYTVPPIRGECMYDPSINSISGAGHISIISEKKAIALK